MLDKACFTGAETEYIHDPSLHRQYILKYQCKLRNPSKTLLLWGGASTPPYIKEKAMLHLKHLHIFPKYLATSCCASSDTAGKAGAWC